MLLCAAMQCYTLLYAAIHWYALQNVAIRCYTLRDAAIRCYTLFYVAIRWYTMPYANMRCKALLYAAIRCWTPLYAAIYCYTLAPCCSKVSKKFFLRSLIFRGYQKNSLKGIKKILFVGTYKKQLVFFTFGERRKLSFAWLFSCEAPNKQVSTKSEARDTRLDIRKT